MKGDEPETKLKLHYRQCPSTEWISYPLLQTRILKIVSECAAIAFTNYVNLTTGTRREKRAKGQKVICCAINVLCYNSTLLLWFFSSFSVLSSVVVLCDPSTYGHSKFYFLYKFTLFTRFRCSMIKPRTLWFVSQSEGITQITRGTAFFRLRGIIVISSNVSLANC